MLTSHLEVGHGTVNRKGSTAWLGKTHCRAHLRVCGHEIQRETSKCVCVLSSQVQLLSSGHRVRNVGYNQC